MQFMLVCRKEDPVKLKVADTGHFNVAKSHMIF